MSVSKAKTSAKRLEAVFPLSPVQQGMLFHALYAPDSGVYFTQIRLALRGQINVEAFERAWQRTVARNSILRTSFAWKKTTQPLQVVHGEVALRLEYRDWRGLPSEQQQEQVKEWLAADLKEPFDMSVAPLMRLALLQESDERSQLVWSFHHILLDGWSVPLVLGEMFEQYEAEVAGRELTSTWRRPYGDYIGWLGEQSREAAARYWRGMLAGFREGTPLPARGRAGEAAGAGTGEVELGDEVYGKLQEMGRREQLTLNTVVQGAWALLLSRYSGREDVVYGATVSGRPVELAGVEQMVGLFINTLPVRVRVGREERVVEWLRKLQQEQVEQRQYEYSSLVEVQGWSEVERGAPLFETILVFENYPIENHLTQKRIEVEELSAIEKTNYPLSLVVGANQTLTLRAYYDKEKFAAETIAELLQHLQNVLASMASDPGQQLGQLSLLSEAEEREQLVAWNGERVEYRRESRVEELFAEQAERRSDAIALVAGGAGKVGEAAGEQVSYGELNERANRLAHYLRRRGVGPEVVVGVCLERSVELIVSLLGILKAGGAYLPLDPEYPEARRAYMMRDAGARVLLTNEKFGAGVGSELARELGSAVEVVSLERAAAELAAESSTNPERRGGADNLAYVMYTSGSTGAPKGIGVTHRNVLRLVSNANYVELSEQNVLLQLASISFDASTFEIWGALTQGGKLVLAAERVPTATELGRVLREQEVDTLWLTSALYNAVVEQEVGELRSLKQLLVGGEALSVRQVRAGLAELDGVELINGYGPTEVTTFSCTHRIRSSAGTAWEQGVPIGRAIGNTEAYVLDRRQQLVPVGVVGELYLGGDGLARGYLGAAGQTAERFVPHPYSTTGGARLYRTGDLVRYDRAGQLEFVGRVDEQLKIRGYRIEPGEVESALRGHESVSEAVVLGRAEESGEKRLVAYVVAAAGAAELSVTELRSYLGGKLPEYMVPAAFVYLKELPLNANGKVDRAALPAPEWQRLLGLASEQEYVGPRTATEEVLCGIWAEVLGVERVGVRDNFFALGGHSLLATRINARLRQAFAVELPLRELFESGSIERLAVAVEAAQRAGAGQPQGPELRRVEREEGEGGRREAPLSYAQQRLWFIEQYAAGSGLYNLGVGFRLRGRLHEAALEQAFAQLVERHESLRTRFEQRAGKPVQVIEETGRIAVEVEEFRGRAEAELEQRVRAEVRQGFDLEAGPLLRVRLLRVADEEQVLLLVMHHIVTDGWSLGVLLRELGVCYEAACRGERGELPELAVQYADYAEWQREWLAGGVLAEQLEYWKQELGGSGGVLELPGEGRRPERLSYAGASVEFQLGRELSGKLRELSRREDVTLYMTLLAGWQLLLARYSGSEEVRVGTPIANRTRAEVEGLIGFLVNTLVLRVGVKRELVVRELLAAVREQCWEAYGHQDVPYEAVVEAVQRERDLSRQGLFDVMFTLQEQGEVGELALAGLAVEWLEVESETARYDLTLTLSDGGEELGGRLEYRTELYGRERMERMVRHYEQVLAGLVADVEAPVWGLQLLSDEEEREQLVAWNGERVEYRRESRVEELFAEQAERRRDAIALVAGGAGEASGEEAGEAAGEQVSYGELNERANRLAHYLRRRGVGPEVVVGVCLERSVELIVSLLGISKAGGAYLPLDPEYPEARRVYMMRDAGARVLLTNEQVGTGVGSELARELGSAVEVVSLERAAAELAAESSANPERQGWADNLAYVMYTSGSTGAPKGIGVTHRNVLRLVSNANYVELGEEAVVAQAATVSFDASTFEIWGALLHGGRLVGVSRGELLTPGELGRVLREQAVNVLFLTTALFNEVVRQEPTALAGVKQVLFGGEQVDVEIVRRLVAGSGKPERLKHVYGPTETTTYATCCEVEEVSEGAATIPIGRAIGNTEAYVLDRRQQLAPVGVVGELYLGGDGLARGYLGAAAQTAERFVPHPYSTTGGARLYRTGDLVRYDRAGQLEFVGRVDGQLKIRGYRIEPGEVESALRGHESVSEAVVLGRAEESGEKRLVAYVVAAAGAAELSVTELRSYLGGKLPEYMLPAAFVYLKELPLNANGKVDRAALPVPRNDTENAYAAPRTPVEELLVEIWSQVLGIPTVGIHDNFFEIGGHSLKAAQVTSRILKECRVRIAVRDLFASPTIAELAEILRDADACEDDDLKKVAEQPFYALSSAQKLIWAGLHFGNSGVYNVPAAYLFEQPVDVVSLERALATIIQRHESLRTTISSLDGEPKQKIHPEIGFRLESVDISTEKNKEAKARELANLEAVARFDLAQGPLLRAVLVKLSPARYVFIVTMHHIISDGWSLSIFMKELLSLYAAYEQGIDLSLPPLKIQYTDYVAWQDRLIKSDEIAADRNYWLNAFAGKLPVLQLPTDYPRPAVKSFNGEVCTFTIEKNLAEDIYLFCREQGVTLFMTLLGSVYALFHRYTGQEDIILGAPSSGRTHKDLEGQIGLYLNMLALRMTVRGAESFAELVQNVRENTLAAFEHQAYPFALLVKELTLERNVGRSLLINAGVTLQNHNVVSGQRQDESGFNISHFEQSIRSSEYDVWFLFSESDHGITATVNYNTDLFKRETIELMWSRLIMLLVQVTSDPQCKIMDLEITAGESDQDTDLDFAIELNF